MSSTGILFLSQHNSVRSQIAEALAHSLLGARADVYSAGSEPTALHPCVVRVMSEIEIDVRGQHAKLIEEMPWERISTVIVLDSEVAWPTMPAHPRRIRCALEDPSKTGVLDTRTLERFRALRDQIQRLLRQYFRRAGVLDSRHASTLLRR